jgi:DnaJ-class molecular chaperone
MARSLYDVLGVPRSADEAEITKAYRKLAKQWHPDVHKGDKRAEERFKEIASAYDVLGDRAKRARYDKGEIDEQGREKGFAPGGGFGGARRGAGPRPSAGMGGFGLDDILSDIMGSVGGGRGRARGGFEGFATGGDDLRLALEVDLEDVARGSVKRVALPDGATLDVTIPAGLESGTTLRLRGKGRQGLGGEPGDALVEVKVRPHPRFTREGQDLRLDEPVPLETAVLGGKLRVATLDGEVVITVPKGSSSGRTLRLKGKGIHDAKVKAAGDLLVRLLVELPRHDAELEAWAKKRAAVEAGA